MKKSLSTCGVIIVAPKMSLILRLQKSRYMGWWRLLLLKMRATKLMFDTIAKI